MENLTMPMLFLSLVINRLVEIGKRSIVDPESTAKEPRWLSPALLAASLFLGAVGVVGMFPSANLFIGLGSSPLAEQAATGIVIGGLANGVNFLTGVATDVKEKVAPAQ